MAKSRKRVRMPPARPLVVQITRLKAEIPAGAKILCNGVGVSPDGLQSWLNLFESEAKDWPTRMRKILVKGLALTIPGHPLRYTVVGDVHRFDQTYVEWRPEAI